MMMPILKSDRIDPRAAQASPGAQASKRSKGSRRWGGCVDWDSRLRAVPPVPVTGEPLHSAAREVHERFMKRSFVRSVGGGGAGVCSVNYAVQ